MLTSPIDSFREDPLTTLGSIVGVVLIVVLLWAVGAVAQGQVKRAHQRDTQVAEQHAVLAQCLRMVASGQVRSCPGSEAPRAEAGLDAVPAQVAVVYR